MQIDLRTVTIDPKRNAFDHLVRRFGDKPASRYQEGSYDIQATENLHYRPTWAPDQELYDPSITKIVMADWHALRDPRQFYYSSYTLTRARQQDTAEANFSFVESHGLIDLLEPEQREVALRVLVPLRHAAWGANQNNTFVCGYGYGVTFTQPCMYHAMDNLGIAQYLSRLGLLLGGTDALNAAKQAWTEEEAWQGLRRYIEDVMAIRDPFEVWLAQNVALDGLLYPAIYGEIVDQALAKEGGSAVAMLTQFMTTWSEETRKWIDGVLKVAAAESEANRDQITTWLDEWLPRATEALRPVVGLTPGADPDAVLASAHATLAARLKKSGLERQEA